MVHVDHLKPHLGRVPEAWRPVLEDELPPDEMPSFGDVSVSSSTVADQSSDDDTEHTEPVAVPVRGNKPTVRLDESDSAREAALTAGLRRTNRHIKAPEKLNL